MEDREKQCKKCAGEVLSVDFISKKGQLFLLVHPASTSRLAYGVPLFCEAGMVGQKILLGLEVFVAQNVFQVEARQVLHVSQQAFRRIR